MFYYHCCDTVEMITDRVSREAKAISSVRPSVRPFVPLGLLNRLTFELELLCMCGSWPAARHRGQSSASSAYGRCNAVGL